MTTTNPGVQFKSDLTITLKDIVTFADATGDHMLPHDPMYMGRKGKLPIAHGLLVLLAAADPALFEHRISQDESHIPNFLSAHFGVPVSAGDTLQLGWGYDNIAGQLGIRLSALTYEGKNALESGSMGTGLAYLQEEAADTYFSPIGINSGAAKFSVAVGDKNYGIFSSLIGVRFNNESNQANNAFEMRVADRDYVSQLEFAIALSSSAAISGIQKNKTQEAGELAELLNSERKMLPVYLGMKVYFPRVTVAAGANMLDFATTVGRVANHQYDLNTECRLPNGGFVYRMRSTIRMIPEAVVLRIAKNYPKA